jgi:hypothetical protein
MAGGWCRWQYADGMTRTLLRRHPSSKMPWPRQSPCVEMRPQDEEAVRRLISWKHRQRRPVSDAQGLTSQQTYADLIKTVFAPALRNVGLRGSGGRFELPSETQWVQLGFQKSAYSDRNEVRFTINLSVISRDVWDAQVAAKPYLGRMPSPNMNYGTWADQERIGKLTPDGEDKWWRIMRGADAAPARDDALFDLLTYGVPWLKARTIS